MTHADIIARLTAATGPDRELDADIAFAAGHFDSKLSYGFEDCCIIKSDERTDDYVHVIVRTKGRTTGGIIYSEPYPAFTASLDATVALIDRVLPGWHLELTTTGFRPGASLFPGTAVSGHGAYAATPALALLLALFRALEAQEPHHG